MVFNGEGEEGGGVYGGGHSLREGGKKAYIDD